MNMASLIAYQVEDWSTTIDELRPLFVEHHSEVALYKDKMPLEPQWWEYARLDRLGQMLLVTARHGGSVVGYCILTIGCGMHYATTLTAKMDALWVGPQYRKGTAGRKLLETTKAELKRRGVKLWWMGSKNHKPIGALFERMGFEAQETYYSTWLGEDA